MTTVLFAPQLTIDGERKLCGCKMEVDRHDTTVLIGFVKRCGEHSAMTEQQAYDDIWSRMLAQSELDRLAEQEGGGGA